MSKVACPNCSQLTRKSKSFRNRVTGQKQNITICRHCACEFDGRELSKQ